MAATNTAASPPTSALGHDGARPGGGDDPRLGSLRSRNPEVEGLRAVAALAVLVTHVSLNSMGNRGPFGGLLSRLDVGVAIFFVLSGYLLYRPFARALLRGEALPSTRRYLRHRLLRIVPAYWLVVLASFLFPAVRGLVMPTTDFGSAAAGVTSVPLRDLLRFASFTQVYWKDSLAGPFPQAWTLAAEMGFYLLLPLLAWGVARRNRGDRAARLRRQWWVLGAMVAVSAAFRAAVVLRAAPYRSGAASNAYTQQLAWLPNHLDLFAVGMAFAVLRVEHADGGPGAAIAARFDRVLGRRGAAGLCAAGALGVLVLLGYGLGLSRTALSHGRLGEFAIHLGYLAVAALAVAPAAFGREGGGLVRAALRTRPMQFLGRISYGIYLWQVLVIGRWVSSPLASAELREASRHPGQQFNVAFWPTLAWTLGVTIILATLTWYLVERPALRYRDRPLGWFAGGLWAISLASLVGRLWAIGTITSRDPGNGDPFYYHAQANMLADRVGFGEPIQWLTQGRFVPTAIHPPLFTLWLTPASLLGARGYLSHKTMAALAGVAVVVVAALLARRLAGPRAGLIAAGLVAIYPNLFVIDGTLWPEGLYTAVVGLALLLAYRWRDRPTTWGAVAIGASIGAAVLARGEAILLLPFLCLPLVVGAARRREPWLRPGLLMGATALAVIAPWTIRNLVQFDERVPISTNSEEVLFYANCDDTYSGPLIGYWSFNCQQRAREERVAQGLPADPPGDESQRAAGWGALGRSYAKSHEDRWAAVAAARLTRAWDLQHSGTTARALQFEGRPYEWSVRGYWAFRLALLPAIAGFAVLRRRRVAIWPLLSMVAMVSVTAVGVYGHPRFRTVGDLVVLVTAAVAIDAIVRRLAPSPEPAP